jgi:hypothetical protein
MTMKYGFLVFVLSLVIATSTNAATFSTYDCVIGGVYILKDGELVQRPERGAIGKNIKIDKSTGEVTGYFGTDGDKITKIRRPDDQLLTLEIAYGVIGDAANLLDVTPQAGNTGLYNFFYKKNWLHISGVCR